MLFKRENIYRKDIRNILDTYLSETNPDKKEAILAIAPFDVCIFPNESGARYYKENTNYYKNNNSSFVYKKILITRVHKPIKDSFYVKGEKDWKVEVYFNIKINESNDITILNMLSLKGGIGLLSIGELASFYNSKYITAKPTSYAFPFWKKAQGFYKNNFFIFLIK